MLTFALVVFREIVEICLILSIVVCAAKNMPKLKALLASGFALGIIGSILIALSINTISDSLEGVGQEVFNASILFITAAFIYAMLLYMKTHAREMKSKFEAKSHSFWGLLFVVAFTIFREGSEIVLFSYSYLLSSGSISELIIGISLGTLAGAMFGGLLYLGMCTIAPQKMFAVINWVLIFVIAGLIVQGMDYLVAADLISAMTTPLWDSSWLISENGMLGSILHNLFGYSSNPSGIQLITYSSSLLFLVVSYKREKIFK